MKTKVDPFEFYGDEMQKVIQQRYYRLWPYLSAHPHLSFVGRALGIDDPSLDDFEQIAGLAMELGFLALAFTQRSIVHELRSLLEEQGLKVSEWDHYLGYDDTESKCQEILNSTQLPPEYRIERIAMSTSPHLLHQGQSLMQYCGVAPLPGYILRGKSVPAIAELVLDPSGDVVSIGAGVFRHHPGGKYGKAAHVGFLATHPNHRGNGFARLLLARIILSCFREFGAELVHTGVRAENIPSQRVCRPCGMDDSGMVFLGVLFPPLFKNAKFTR